MKQFDTDSETSPLSEDYKPTYIHEQHNTNCQQFFGPITNCTFTMPAASASHAKTPKAPSKKGKGSSMPFNTTPQTIKYYTHGNNGILMKQRKRVDLIFKKWTEWKWIGIKTSANDFDSFFEGEPRHCNIIWKANTTILTLLLQDLLNQSYITKQTRQSAKSLVEQQFGKTPNFDKTRLDNDAEEKIKISLYILDISNPLPENDSYGETEEFDTRDEALRLVLSGMLRETKGI